MKYLSPPKKLSILWTVLRQQFISTVGTVVSMVLFFVVLSLFITLASPWETTIESFIGFDFYSKPYYLLLGAILILGIIFAIFFTIFIGYPLGRELRRNLQSITDGADAFSRGKLNHRIKVEGSNEVIKVSQQFNNMADRIEKQVNSLQRLINENTRLVNQTKITAALDERRKLARDLHDAVSQQLFAISMTLSALPKLMDKDMEKAKKYFLQVEDMVGNAQQELRALIMHLRPVTLEGNSLREGIDKLLEELQAKHPKIEWRRDIEKDIKLSQGVEDHLFRVVQEAISNMLRHSKATIFHTKFYRKKDLIYLTLEDNGVGFDVSDKKKSSYGLKGMKERIEDIGGRFDIITYPNKGTRIEIRVPIKSL